MRRARAWLSRLPVADRVAVALGLLLLVLFVFADEGEADTLASTSPPAGGAVALLTASVLVLLLRRRFPGTVVLATMVLTSVWYLAGYRHGAINIPILIAYYHLGTTGDRRRQFGVGGVALAAPAIVILFLVAVDSPAGASMSMIPDAVGYPLAAMLFGEVVRHRRLLLDQYAEKAAQAEANLDTEAERRVAEERVRIARDVHDVLAHAVSVMTVQAGVGEDALDRDPAAVKDALATIRSSGKDAMAEMRATVAVLRGSDQVETTPAPGLDQVAELVDGARAKGLDVELRIGGGSGGRDDGDGPDRGDVGGDPGDHVRGVESVVRVAAYRVVQESLTNVIRHAKASRAVIRVERHRSQLTVAVTDDGSRPGGPDGQLRPPTMGFGLRGMRERVESLGGTLQCGWRPAGGWEVVASLPVRPAP